MNRQPSARRSLSRRSVLRAGWHELSGAHLYQHRIQFIAHIPPRVDPNGILVAFCHGRAMDGLNRLKPSDLGKAVVEEIVCLRPAAAGRLDILERLNKA